MELEVLWWVLIKTLRPLSAQAVVGQCTMRSMLWLVWELSRSTSRGSSLRVRSGVLTDYWRSREWWMVAGIR